MRTPKKITWSFLYRYSYSKNVIKDSKDSIIFRYDDKYFLGFVRDGRVKLYPAPDWWNNFVIISRNMSYEDMFFIIKQLKEITTPKFKNLEKAVEK